MEILKIKKLHPDAHIPTRAHDTDAGMDLYALPIQYTDKEKENYKNIVDNSVMSMKLFDLLGGIGLFGDEPVSDEKKKAADAISKAPKSDLENSWEGFFSKKIVVPAHETVMIPTGISISVPTGYMGCIYARSGLASKKSLAPINCVGIIDSDFRGEVKVALHNHGDKNQILDVGDRIAQLVIQPISLCQTEVVDELDETDRGTGGFGSSGEK